MNHLKPKGILEIQLREANIGQDYWHVDFSNYRGPDKAKRVTMNYLRKLDQFKDKGIGLLYLGPPGPGKTTMALIAMKYLVRARWSVYCTSLGEIVENIQRTWRSNDHDDLDSRDFLERCRRADFLFIDDVGKEHRGQSGFVQTVFDNLIRYRVQHRLPTFLTTNLTKSELEGIYGESVMSLIEGKSIGVVVEGSDYRKTTLKDDAKRILRG